MRLSRRVGEGALLAIVATVGSVLLGRGLRAEFSPGHFAALMVVVGLAGGVAGAVYSRTEMLRQQGGWRKSVANVATLLAFCAVAGGILFAGATLLSEP